ncbi:MAG: glycine cleavage system aminomethyltransferase GcvT [Kiritimatiellae bacterium]|nr:glycine cleavage system aminomethyltransferase GcvT [Kiritimatiellia bacterium]
MRTPLYEEHRALGARIVEFAGWQMPLQYTGILAEHQSVRTACGVFDTCHMGEFELSGPSAEADLERLLTMRISTLAVGQCRYGYLLRDDGGVLDDLTCYRLAPDRFWLIVNAGPRASDWQWICARVSAGTRLRDRSGELGKLDVQGPAAWRVLAAALGRAAPPLKYFRLTETEWEGRPMVISRTGYTGEWGYEVYLPAEATVELWRRLLAGGASPAGLGARDTLRLEMGYPLYGHELSVEQTPVAASRGAFVDLGKEFIGREAVRRDLERGCNRYLTGLRFHGRRAARAGAAVCVGERAAGRVTSGAFAPSLGVGVALAYLDADLTEEGREVEVVSERTRLPATVTAPPFWTAGTARAAQPPGGA